MTDQARLTWALGLSVLAHLLILALLPLWRHAQIDIPAPSFVDVDLAPAPKAPPRAAAVPRAAAPAPAPPAVPVPKQIVAMPEQGEEKEPENARFLSDRDNTVKEETVRHGEPLAGDPDVKPKPPSDATKVEPKAEAKSKPEAPKAKPATAPRPPAERKPQLASLPKLDQLLPQPGDFIRGGGGALRQPQEAEPAPEQQASAPRGQDLLRYGDPWRSGGTRGATLDALQNIREGDITLLNTKAEKFAPFVRRVAVRVFQNFVITATRSSSEGGAAEEYAVIEAVMDRQGNLLKLVTQDRSLSASLATDRNLQAAIRDGFFDRNPPSGAEAADGLIHFAFQARVVLMVEPSGRRSPGYIFLATGLM